jgi:hypothetical protein
VLQLSESLSILVIEREVFRPQPHVEPLRSTRGFRVRKLTSVLATVCAKSGVPRERLRS